jgi:hypothetical protein
MPQRRRRHAPILLRARLLRQILGLASSGHTIYTLRPHIDVYLLAAKYDIPGLKTLAAVKFEARAAVLSGLEDNVDRFL